MKLGSMTREGICVCIVILLGFVSYSEAYRYYPKKFEKLYSPCISDNDCSYQNEQVNQMACVDGLCKCNEPQYTLFIKVGDFSFAFTEDDRVELSCRELKKAGHVYGSARAEFVCKKYDEGEHCLCPDGTYYVDDLIVDGCKNIAREGFGAYCNGFQKFCDFNKRFECQGSMCKCKRNFMYDFDKKICIPKSTYMEENNLTSYRVTYGVYCSSDSDCLEGLDCRDDFKCHCPRFCDYDKKRNSCDCGEVGVDVAPVVVGVFGGFFIIVFWCMMIRKSVLKHREKKSVCGNTSIPLVGSSSAPARSSSPVGQSSAPTAAPLPYALHTSSAPQADTSAAEQLVNSNPPSYSELHESNNPAGPLPYPVAPVPNPNLAYPMPSAPPDVMSDSSPAEANFTGNEKPVPPYLQSDTTNSAAPIGFSAPQLDPPSYDEAVKKTEM